MFTHRTVARTPMHVLSTVSSVSAAQTMICYTIHDKRGAGSKFTRTLLNEHMHQLCTTVWITLQHINR